VAKTLGLDGINWHSFRHSFVVNQRRSGTHAKVIAGVLGHSGTQLQAEVYNHYEEAESREPIAKLLQTVMNSSRAELNHPQNAASDSLVGPQGFEPRTKGL